MAVARDDLGRAARKQGIEGQVTTMASFAYVPSYTFLVQYGIEYFWGMIAHDYHT